MQSRWTQGSYASKLGTHRTCHSLCQMVESKSANGEFMAKTNLKKKSSACSFAHLISDAPATGIEAVRFIRDGYPASVLKDVSKYFGVPESRIQKILHVAPSTANRLEKKAANIDSGATERVFRMGLVTRMAIEVFEDSDSAIKWMCRPNRLLGDVAPLELMDTEPGAKSVQLLLNAIAIGGVA